MKISVRRKAVDLVRRLAGKSQWLDSNSLVSEGKEKNPWERGWDFNTGFWPCNGISAGLQLNEALIFSQAFSFQLLKLENLLRWSLFTLIYNCCTNMNYFISCFTVSCYRKSYSYSRNTYCLFIIIPYHTISYLIIHQIFSLAHDSSKHVTWPNIPQLKLGDIRD